MAAPSYTTTPYKKRNLGYVFNITGNLNLGLIYVILRQS